MQLHFLTLFVTLLLILQIQVAKADTELFIEQCQRLSISEFREYLHSCRNVIDTYEKDKNALNFIANSDVMFMGKFYEKYPILGYGEVLGDIMKGTLSVTTLNEIKRQLYWHEIMMAIPYNLNNEQKLALDRLLLEKNRTKTPYHDLAALNPFIKCLPEEAQKGLEVRLSDQFEKLDVEKRTEIHRITMAILYRRYMQGEVETAPVNKKTNASTFLSASAAVWFLASSMAFLLM